MKLEKEVKIIRVKSEKSINAKDNYTEIKLDGALSLKDFKNIVDNFVRKKAKLILEVEGPILDEVERKYLSGVVRPFRDRVNCIKKLGGSPTQYISISLKDDFPILFPYFKKNTMYKDMELNKEYTLEELGL